jgi:hypothetical protein
MTALLAFAPFIVFAIVDRLVDPTVGLLAGAGTAAVMLSKTVVLAGKSPKVMDLGTLVLFGSLGVYSLLLRPEWSIITVRLLVDCGLLAIVLISVAIGQPFTLQYAREKVEATRWADPAFVRSNYVITLVWALAFAIMVGADLVMLLMPHVPLWVGITATVSALVSAVHFTSWYPRHIRAKAGTAA